MPLVHLIEDSKLPMLALLSELSCAVIMADEYGQIVFWNHGAQLLFGYSRAEVIRQNLKMLMPERYIAAHEAALGKRAIDGCAVSSIIGNTVEIFGKRKDGSEFPVEISILAHELLGHRCYLAIISDMTDQSRLQSAKLIAMQLEKLNIKLPSKEVPEEYAGD